MPASNEEHDIKIARLSRDIINNAYEKLNLDAKITEATKWSEVCGSVFYKIVWNSSAGRNIAKNRDNQLIYEGEVEVIVVPPYELFPDSSCSPTVEDCASIIHAKAYNVNAIKNIWGVDVKGSNIDVFSLEKAHTLGGLGYSGSATRVGAGTKSNHAIVIEKYEVPTIKYPEGRLVIVCEDKLLYNKKQYALLFYADDNKLYWCKMFSPDYNTYVLYDTVMNSKPTVINYRLNERDILILCSPDDTMTVWNGDVIPYKINTAPKIKSMTLYQNRLFAVVADDRRRLWYSSNLDPTSWINTGEFEGAGNLPVADENGELNKIITFLDGMFLFRDFSITKIIQQGEQFLINNLYISGSKIFADTVCICSNKMWILTDEGIHIFDGVRTQKISLGLEKLFKGVDNNNAFGSFHNGKYYLACRLKFDDSDIIGDEENEDWVNNALIVVDIQSHDYNIIRGIDICHMLPLNEENISKLLVCTRGNNGHRVGEVDASGKYFNTVLKKSFKTPKNDFLSAKKYKIIKEVFIQSQNNCLLKIVADSKQKTFEVKGSDKLIRLDVRMRGRLLQFELTSDSLQNNIGAPEIILGLV